MKYIKLGSLFVVCLVASWFVLLSCKQVQIDYEQRQEVFDRSQKISSLAFGSCNKHTKAQPLWNAIVNNNPDVWIWLGDIVYGDTENMELLQEKYTAQKSNEAYQQLYQSDCDIVGVWDDHDYGVNDGGKEYPKKAESKEVLFDFLEIEKDNPARKREGAYTSYLYGPEGEQVKLILLDARSFRDPLNKNGVGHNIPNETGDILGEDQWNWLEQELSNSTAQVHIIGSGIQFIPTEHRFEKWANFPTARQRFFDLLVSYNIPNVVLISGDRHIGEISTYQGDNMQAPIYEITSSGLTHCYKGNKKEVNPYRHGKLVRELNFGMISIDWEKSKIQLDIRGEEDVLLESLVF